MQAASSKADDVFAPFCTPVMVLLLSIFKEFCLFIIGVDVGSLLTRGGELPAPIFERDYENMLTPGAAI